MKVKAQETLLSYNSVKTIEFTTAEDLNDLEPGDVFRFKYPWWKRAWHWVIRKKPVTYRITSMSS